MLSYCAEKGFSFLTVPEFWSYKLHTKFRFLRILFACKLWRQQKKTITRQFTFISIFCKVRRAWEAVEVLLEQRLSGNLSESDKVYYACRKDSVKTNTCNQKCDRFAKTFQRKKIHDCFQPSVLTKIWIQIYIEKSPRRKVSFVANFVALLDLNFTTIVK